MVTVVSRPCNAFTRAVYLASQPSVRPPCASNLDCKPCVIFLAAASPLSLPAFTSSIVCFRFNISTFTELWFVFASFISLCKSSIIIWLDLIASAWRSLDALPSTTCCSNASSCCFAASIILCFNSTKLSSLSIDTCFVSSNFFSRFAYFSSAASSNPAFNNELLCSAASEAICSTRACAFAISARDSAAAAEAAVNFPAASSSFAVNAAVCASSAAFNAASERVCLLT